MESEATFTVQQFAATAVMMYLCKFFSVFCPFIWIFFFSFACHSFVSTFEENSFIKTFVLHNLTILACVAPFAIDMVGRIF